VSQQTQLDRAVSEILVDEETLQARIVELGQEISADYAGREVLLIGVLKGAVFFMADLMRQLTVPCELDTNRYPTGISVADADMAALNITRADFHGEWNYTISPNQPSQSG
jgi:hypoxanthine-guanine phosphoribosyltransferase